MYSLLLINQLIWSFHALYVNGESNWTTASNWNGPRVKPTTLVKSIAAEKYAGKQPSDFPSIFDKMKPSRRRNNPDIWNWDYWCQLQTKKGNCSKRFLRFYYDSHLDRCRKFHYSGCNGNQNNFETLLECDRHCKGAALMPMEPLESTIVCALQPNAGLCLATFKKYYYDVNEGTCKTFLYGGCGGNENRFSTLHRCLRKCPANAVIED